MSTNPKPSAPRPPHLADHLLAWFVAPHLLETLQGDLHEEFAYQVERVGERRARWRYWRDVLGFVRPYVIKRQPNEYSTPNNSTMLRNYLKVAFRNLVRHKGYSAINIGGLATGMAVAMLIGLWIYDELSFDNYYANYSRIARVIEQQTANGTTFTSNAIAIPLRAALQNEHSSDFTHLALSSWTQEYILANGGNKFTKTGNYVESEFTQMLPLKMVKGSQNGLDDPASILLSESVANALFGTADPINKIIKVNNKQFVKVTGVYEDFPYNTEFRLVTFLLSWQQYLVDQPWVKRSENNWGNNSFQLFVEIAPNTDFERVSAKISKIKARHAKDEARFNPTEILHPMSRWHLYSDWENGVLLRGRIQFVWLFGTIGVFVLLLACINFMNLSTARSEKRAKEVGIRKAVGSLRSQLVNQFFSESFLVVLLALSLSLLLVQLSLPWFNEIADKKTAIPWTNPVLWSICLGLSLLTGFIAGSYPAFYLSSFQPIKVLKGTIRVGRSAATPRKALVVVQFTVSITIIIGTIIVFRQIQHAKDRPVGYDRSGLLTVLMNTPDFYGHYDAIRNELMRTDAAVNMAETSSPTTDLWATDASFNWKGKAHNQIGDFGTVAVTHDYGRTVGWQFKQGRDFSRDFATDSLGIIVNEKAVKFMGFKNPISEYVQWNGKIYSIIGVVKDVVMSSPFEPVKPTVFLLDYDWANLILVKLNPQLSAGEALNRIEPVFRKYNPGSPFDYKFASDEYDQKFRTEERIGQLSTVFAILAIFISCLGLFGLASFTAEQRTKEIGVRKVLGASVFTLWQLLSKDFIILVLISLLIASPLAYYFMNDWLQQYPYRSTISWWIFAATGAGALLITLLTVSFQSIKAALMNPVKSLRSE
ncbi:Macrolide export ATP-binding/permease protein macB [Fibrisoma limi BUZ 3]|uniref:Macrolide export ATP-binding/permease protein macB n=1 Tax=Fibrisoma limi BUZ 3 TaxID=1185876 RepID=I2GEY6_9BACT|nr:permease prefix domain 2-containing transporter [Fibrisoma limi]CCH52461.1 Macrolide export ATP-binding/permease protein macB [Fibrisoma limi BUZ 3]